MYKTPLTRIYMTETEPPGRYLGHRTACKHSPAQWLNNPPQGAPASSRSPPSLDYYSVRSTIKVKQTLKTRIALNVTPMTELRHLPYGIICVTCYPTQVNAPHPNTSPQAGTQFIYPGGMEGWVDLGYPAVDQPGVKLVTSPSQVRRPNHYTTE